MGGANGTVVTAGTVLTLTTLGGGTNFNGLSLTNAALVFVPNPNIFGNPNPLTSFTFQVQDDGGTAGGAVDTDPSPKVLTLHVLPVNDAPTGTDAQTTVFTTTGQNTHTFTLADFGYSDTADNPLPNNLKFVNITSITGINAADSFTDNNNPVTLNQAIPLADITGGQLKFTGPTIGSAHNSSFTFKVQDVAGTATVTGSNAAAGNTSVDGKDTDQTDRTFTLQVRVAGGHAPVGQDHTMTVVEDIPYILSFTNVPSTAGDFPYTDQENDSLLSIKITGIPTQGSLTDNGTAVQLNQVIPVADLTNGKLKYQGGLNAYRNNYDSFTFTLKDSGGTALGGSDQELTSHTQTINILPVNDAPVGVNKSVATREDTAIAFAPTDFALNDSNDLPSTNSLNGIFITGLPAAASGTLLLSGSPVSAGTFIPKNSISGLTFQPNLNSNASASFKFKVQDDGGTATVTGSDQPIASTDTGKDTDANDKTMSITVTPVSDAPSAPTARPARPSALWRTPIIPSRWRTSASLIRMIRLRMPSRA